MLVVAAVAGGCGTVDPGPSFVIPNQTFNEGYFYCTVEPTLIFGKKCGPGDAADKGNCHFNSSAVSGMALLDHPPVDCTGDSTPANAAQTGLGSAARANYTSVSLEMSRDYLTAPLYVRPTSSQAHPRVIFNTNDPVVDVISKWASKP
jgi:hypothetical protein